MKALRLFVARTALRSRFTVLDRLFAKIKACIYDSLTRLRPRFKQPTVASNTWAVPLGFVLLTVLVANAHGGVVLNLTTNVSSGTNPQGSLVLVNGILYGTTFSSGVGYGTVFKVNPNGTGFKVIHTFTTKMVSTLYRLTADGQKPSAGLVADANGQWLYGTTQRGGGYGFGTVFAIEVTDDGSDMDSQGNPTYTILLSFDGSYGTQPSGRLTLSSDGTTLYGTTAAPGGTVVGATVFALGIITQGTATAVPTAYLSPNYYSLTVAQGSILKGDLLLTNGWLYGTASFGGANGYGSVFALSTPVSSSSTFVPLYSFTGSMNNVGPNGSTIQDSANPAAGLLLIGNILYGTTAGAPAGPALNYGSVFAIYVHGLASDSSGTPGRNGSILWAYPLPMGEATLGDLCAEVPPQPPYPGTLLATVAGTGLGNSSSASDPAGPAGAVLEIETDGMMPNYTALDKNGDQGASPQAGLIPGPSPFPFFFKPPFPFLNEYFYGTAFYGGNGGNGTVFNLNSWGFKEFRPLINGGFQVQWVDPPAVSLQSAPTLTGSWTNVAGPGSSYTNTSTAPAQFFRLMFNLTNFPVLPPAVTTLPASGIGPSQAMLNGFVVPNRTNSTAWFEWGTTTNYGNLTSTTFVSATNLLTVSSSIGGLLAGGTYHYQIVASNSTGTSTGGDLTFSISPALTTLPASSIGPSNANLNGLVRPNGFDCTAYFQYGTSSNYGATTSSLFVSGTNNTVIGVSNLVSGLLAGTLYHFQLAAMCSLGTSTGADLTFTTPNYVGNSLTVTNGAPDGGAPLVILGEYSPAGPLSNSTVSLPAGTVQDVRFYGQSFNFTLYALSNVTNGPYHNEQTFQVVASQRFSNSIASPGVQTLPVYDFSVNAGDLLAFAGQGPYYPQASNDVTNSDATYEDSSNPGSSTAAPPGGPLTLFSVGHNPDTNATYEYISNVFTNQGRTYGIGVDILPGSP